MRALLPVRGYAEPPLVVPGQRGQCLMDAGQVGGPVVGQHDQHAQQQGTDQQLPGAHPGGQQQLDPRGDAGAVDDLLQLRQRDHHDQAAPSSRTAVACGCRKLRHLMRPGHTRGSGRRRAGPGAEPGHSCSEHADAHARLAGSVAVPGVACPDFDHDPGRSRAVKH